MSGPSLIWCPFADEASAEAAASRLLDEGLVACANIVPGVRAMYIWRGERGEARECAVLFKTHAQLLERATQRLAEIHPYDAPSVIGWRADTAAPVTSAWLAALVESSA